MHLTGTMESLAMMMAPRMAVATWVTGLQGQEYIGRSLHLKLFMSGVKGYNHWIIVQCSGDCSSGETEEGPTCSTDLLAALHPQAHVPVVVADRHERLKPEDEDGDGDEDEDEEG